MGSEFAICCTGGTTRSAPPVFLVTLVRVLYLIMGYFIVSLVCCLCNYRYRFIGGVEFVENQSDPHVLRMTQAQLSQEKPIERQPVNVPCLWPTPVKIGSVDDVRMYQYVVTDGL